MTDESEQESVDLEEIAAALRGNHAAKAVAETEAKLQAAPDQPEPPPTPDPNGPPRTIFHVEREQVGPDMGELVKPYRRFWGKPYKGMDLEKVEIEWDSQDGTVASDLWLVPRGCDDVPGGAGASDRLKDGRILTFHPERFGTEQERLSAGKKPLKRLPWEEHSYVEPDFDAAPPPDAPPGEK